VALVVATGVASRFWATSPLWLDEAQSVAIARLPPAELVAALRGDGAPPLYHLLLHGWTGLVGTGDTAVRALSGMFAAATLPLFHLLGRRLGAGTVTLVLAAVNPWLVRYATEARPYALVVLVVLLGVLTLEGVLRRPGPLRALGLALVTGLLLLTHHWALFLYAVVGAGLLSRVVPPHRGRRTAARPPTHAGVGPGRARRRRAAVPPLASDVPAPGAAHRHTLGRPERPSGDPARAGGLVRRRGATGGARAGDLAAAGLGRVR